MTPPNRPLDASKSPFYFANFLREGLVLLSALCLISAPLHAQQIRAWNVAGDGSFQDPNNWNPNGVPGTNAGDTANLYSIAPTYEITSTASVTIATLNAGAAAPTLDFGGNTLTVSGNFTNGFGFGTAATNTTWTNGTFDLGGFVTLDAKANNSVLNISGATANIGASIAASANALVLGINGSSTRKGTLNITNGSQVTVLNGRTDIGRETGGNGELNVDGAATSVNLGSGLVWVARSANSIGSLNITNGAEVTSQEEILLGQGSGSSGTLSIDGTGSSYTTSLRGYVGGSSAGPVGTGVMSVTNGGQYKGTSAFGILQVWNDGTVYVGTGGSVSNVTTNIGTTISSANDGARLMGTGSVLGRVGSANNQVNLSGELLPGDTLAGSAIGKLTLGVSGTPVKLAMTDFATTSMDFDSLALADQVEVNGALVVNGTLRLNFNYAPSNADSFVLFTSTDGSGAFDSIQWLGQATGGTAGFIGENYVISNIDAVPEPTTAWMLLLGGLAITGLRGNRRRRLQGSVPSSR